MMNDETMDCILYCRLDTQYDYFNLLGIGKKCIGINVTRVYILPTGSFADIV